MHSFGSDYTASRHSPPAFSLLTLQGRPLERPHLPTRPAVFGKESDADGVGPFAVPHGIEKGWPCLLEAWRCSAKLKRKSVSVSSSFLSLPSQCPVQKINLYHFIVILMWSREEVGSAFTYFAMLTKIWTELT